MTPTPDLFAGLNPGFGEGDLGASRDLNPDGRRQAGGRGITCDPQWMTFDRFLADMGERPSGATLDRENNDGDYTKANCRWATPVQQARNRRNSIMTYETAYETCCLLLGGATARSVAETFGCSESLPREILKGRTWADASAAARSDWARDHG